MGEYITGINKLIFKLKKNFEAESHSVVQADLGLIGVVLASLLLTAILLPQLLVNYHTWLNKLIFKIREAVSEYFKSFIRPHRTWFV